MSSVNEVRGSGSTSRRDLLKLAGSTALASAIPISRGSTGVPPEAFCSANDLLPTFARFADYAEILHQKRRVEDPLALLPMADKEACEFDLTKKLFALAENPPRNQTLLSESIDDLYTAVSKMSQKILGISSSPGVSSVKLEHLIGEDLNQYYDRLFVINDVSLPIRRILPEAIIPENKLELYNRRISHLISGLAVSDLDLDQSAKIIRQFIVGYKNELFPPAPAQSPSQRRGSLVGALLAQPSGT